MAPRDFASYRRSPVFYFFCALLLLHSLAFIPQMIAEKKVAQMGREFREHWETGYARHLAEQGKSIDAAAYRRELNKFLQTYTGEKLLYSVQVVPDRFSPFSIFFSWIVQPGARGWFGLILFFVFFWPVGLFLTDRWGPYKTGGFFLLGAALGSLLYLLVTLFWIRRGGTLPFSGVMHGAAFIMGAFFRFHRKSNLALVLRKKGHWKAIRIPFIAYISLWAFWEFVCNWFIFPDNYGRAFFLAIPLFGLGAWLSVKVLVRKISITEILKNKAKVGVNVDLVEELRVRSTQKVEQGFALFDGTDFEGAAEQLRQGMEGLLRDSKTNRALIASTVQRLLQEKLQLRLEPQVWLDWGHALAELGESQLAIPALERAVRAGLSALASRNALIVIAEHRLNLGLEPEKARAYLQKVIQFNADDICGRRAKEILETKVN